MRYYKRDRRAAERNSAAMRFQAGALARRITPESHPMLWGIAQAVADGNPASMAGLGQREADIVRSWTKQIQRERTQRQQGRAQ